MIAHALHTVRVWLSRHKLYVHLLVIASISVSLAIDGAKPADIQFLGLSLLCELN
jgi:hypothetical protein